MSRIDQALRRAGSAVRADQSPGDSATLFRSAWPVAQVSTPGPPVDRGGASDRILATDHRGPVQGFAREWRERLAWGPEGRPELLEQFRRLAANLYHAQNAKGLRTLMVTSAATGDGKTLTAINLALVLSESYRRRVLLVDADLRRPSMGSLVDAEIGRGLSETLGSPSDEKIQLVSITRTLTLLPAGKAMPDPISSFTSARMRQILEDAAEHFDWIVLDAPPAEPLADASLLATMVDGALFVVRAGRTPYHVIQKSIEIVGRERILGVVLTDLPRMPVESYQPYDVEIAAAAPPE